jgi:hypothetical protein|tara:strand:+ start:88 stop:549 length:462 start_codon:yes stop_codon:yes gene_type:complete
MVQRRTNKGVIIDMEALLAQNSDEPAMGNMKVNAKGDVLGKNGEIIQTAEDRARAYYTENPKSSTAKSTLKGAQPDQPAQTDSEMEPEVKTAEAQKTEANQSVIDQVDPASVPAQADEERTPVGYKEVELPNGDIEMVPIYDDEDDWENDANS